jgi:DNA-binding GntR family transcriptional regulator
LALADQVVARLREAILQGSLMPGEQLREAALATSLGVSRGPVREALNQLEREGLVIMRPNRSAIVARLSARDLEEVFSLRQALEHLAVEYACRAATADHLAGLQQVVQAMRNTPDTRLDEQEAARLDLEFHDVLFRASGHQRLIDCWTDLKPQIHIFLLNRNTANPDFRELLVRGHQDIVDIIAAGNVEQATRLIDLHLDTGYRRVLAGYEASGRDGAARDDT